MTEAAIVAEHISKRYMIGQTQSTSFRETINTSIRKFIGGKITSLTEFWALNDVSFQINKGDAVGIIGRNGAGKSTLLKILSRITVPTKGRVSINGRVASLLEVGTGFHPELTGRENVFMNGSLLGMKQKEITKKFDEIIEFSGVEKFIDTPVKFYSSGMYVRLAFAVAAHLEPEILIVDEVLAVGDAEFQKKCLGKMEEVGREGRTILFVSHNMTAVNELCKNIFVIEKGNIVYSGNAKQGIVNYLQITSNNLGAVDWSEEQMPGNDIIKFKSIKALPADTQNVITTDSGVRIETKFYNFKENINLDFTIYLKNEEGILLFESGMIITNNKNSKKGLYKISAVIPANLLNTGKYYCTFVFGESQRYLLYKIENIFSFEMENSLSGRGSNMNVAPGIILPKLKWESELINSK